MLIRRPMHCSTNICLGAPYLQVALDRALRNPYMSRSIMLVRAIQSTSGSDNRDRRWQKQMNPKSPLTDLTILVWDCFRDHSIFSTPSPPTDSSPSSPPPPSSSSSTSPATSSPSSPPFPSPPSSSSPPSSASAPRRAGESEQPYEEGRVGTTVQPSV